MKSWVSQSNNWLVSLLVTLQTTWYTTGPVLLPLEDVPGPALHSGEASQDGSLPIPSLQALQVRDRNPQAWASRMFFQWKHRPVATPHHPESTSFPDSRISSPPWAVQHRCWYGTSYYPTSSSHTQLRERSTSSRVCTYQVRSELEQTFNLLRTTGLADAADKLCTMINMLFN